MNNVSNLNNKLVEQVIKLFFMVKSLYFKNIKIIFNNIRNNKYIINKLKLEIEFENLECAISCCLALI